MEQMKSNQPFKGDGADEEGIVARGGLHGLSGKLSSDITELNNLLNKLADMRAVLCGGRPEEERTISPDNPVNALLDELNSRELDLAGLISDCHVVVDEIQNETF